MPTEILYLSTFLIALSIVLGTTPLVKKLGLRFGRVDKPDERKVHVQPMVRLGGVAIFLGTAIAWLSFLGLGNFPFTTVSSLSMAGVILGAIAFFGIGLLDDLFELGAITRLIMQFIVAAIAWVMGVQIEYLALPGVGVFTLGVLSLPITLLWLVGMVNAINWIDGLDGLAAGVTGIISSLFFVALLYVGQPVVALVAIALAGAALGFLRYNFNPAQLFMGDGGSYFMGFTMASLAVIGFAEEPNATTVMLPYLIMLVPLADMTNVVFSRLASGASPFKPDKRHLHHKLLALGFSQRTAVLFIYGLTFWSGSFALAIAGLENGYFLWLTSSIILGVLSWQCWRQRTLPKAPEKS